jgi:hypothetical protein
MPYVSKAEQERQKWMTLKDTMSHIQHVDQCDEKTAFNSLRNALSDAVVAYQLEDNGRFFVPNFFERGRHRWLERYFWTFISIDLERGGTIDADAYEKCFWGEGLENWYDPDVVSIQEADLTVSSNLNIFVLKEDVLKTWGNRPPEGAEERTVSAQKVPRPMNASPAEIRRALAYIYDEAEKAEKRPPNVIEAPREVAKVLAPKLAPKRKVEKILPEFKHRRFRPGQRTRKKK